MLEEIDTDRIKSPKVLLRSVDENLYWLKSSIKQNGLLQPIVVRPSGDEFEVVAGNRRFQVCMMLKFRKVPCHIVDLEDKEALEFSITENVQRESLNPLEEAHIFKQYVEHYGWGGISELANRIGKSVTYVSRRIKLLALPPELQEEFLRRRKNPGIVSEILAVEDVDMVKEISEVVLKEGLSRKDTRKLVKTLKSDFEHISGNKELRVRDYPLDLNFKFEEETLNKCITILKLDLARISDIINDSTGISDWLFQELMLERRYALHQLLDSFIVIRNRIRRHKLRNCHSQLCAVM